MRGTALFIGAHPDDIEAGAGGLAAHLAAHRWRVVFFVGTTGASGGPLEVRIPEQKHAAEILRAELMWGGFRDGDLPFDRSAIVQLESLLATLTPRLVVTHFPNDTHQDHDRLARVAMAAARRHANVLFFEGPSSLGFQPTMYHVLDKRSYQRKLDAVAAHSSQLGRTGLYEFVDATARRRGYDSRSGALAEGFVPYRSSVFLGE